MTTVKVLRSLFRPPNTPAFGRTWKFSRIAQT